MKYDSVQSKTIEWLRFFCAVLVVFIHSFGPRVASYMNGAYDTIRILLSQGFCRVAVPIFFLISGYLFFVRLEEWNTQVWFHKLKNRVHTLLIPYLIWNLIAIALSLFFYCSDYIFRGGDSPDLISWFESIGGLRAFWNSRSGKWPIDGPLWFIRDLIVLVVLSPIVYYYLKKTRLIGLLILGILYMFNWWIDIQGFSKLGFLFFSIGAYFSINKIEFAPLFEKYRLYTSCLAIPILIGMVLLYGNNYSAYYSFRDAFTIAGSASVIGIVSSLINKDKIREKEFLSNSSFLIFAAHNVFLLFIITSHLKRIMPGASQMVLILNYFAAPTITIAILLGCYYLMHKLTPRLLAFVTGGR